MDLIWYDLNLEERASFNTTVLFLTKIPRIHDQVRSKRSTESRGVFTFIDSLAQDYLEFVAQAYQAIFRQTIARKLSSQRSLSFLR